MVVLRKFLEPTVKPEEVILKPQRHGQKQSIGRPEPRRVGQESQQKLQQESRSLEVRQEDIARGQQPQEFINDPMSGAHVQEHLNKMQNREAPPELNPGARVRSPNAELVQPSNFQSFYNSLGLIDNIGDQALGAAQARAAHKRQQALMAILSQQPPSFRGAGRLRGGRSYGSGIPSSPNANFRFAQQTAPKFGWGPRELSAWYTLGMKESGWRNTAQNPTSTAFGIGQFLDSTWSGVGGRKTSDPRLQVEYMARYIRNRYGSPSRALAFHYANNWY